AVRHVENSVQRIARGCVVDAGGVHTIAVLCLLARKMIVLVGGDDEQGIALVDSCRGEPVEKLRKGIVILLQSGDVRGLARTVRAATGVVVVRVRDVGERYRDAEFLHLRNIAERRRRAHTVESRKAGLPKTVGDRGSIDVADSRRTVGDSWVD